jgi:DNA-binding MarR family transcriptional regulator
MGLDHYRIKPHTGKALHVGIALWHLAGMKNTGEVKLSGKLQRKMGIQRTTGYNALNALEKAQLVSVKRHQGRNPIVTILKAPHAINNEEN